MSKVGTFAPALRLAYEWEFCNLQTVCGVFTCRQQENWLFRELISDLYKLHTCIKVHMLLHTNGNFVTFKDHPSGVKTLLPRLYVSLMSGMMEGSRVEVIYDSGASRVNVLGWNTTWMPVE